MKLCSRIYNLNSVEKLKSTQSRKLFTISKYSRMQSLNIIGAREDFLFEFAILSGVWKFQNIFYSVGPTCQWQTHISNRARRWQHPRCMPPTRSPRGDRAHGGERISTGHCRSSPLPMPGRPLSRSKKGSPPFPSSSCIASTLPSSCRPHCSSSPATSVHRCHQPSRRTTPPSPPLRVVETTSPSRWPTAPERTIHRAAIFLSLLHRRPSPSEHLWPRHHI
jgi:hypothetical protein